MKQNNERTERSEKVHRIDRNERTERNRNKSTVLGTAKSLNKTIVEESNLRKDINNFFSKTPRKLINTKDNMNEIFKDRDEKLTKDKEDRMKRSKSFYKNEFIPKYNNLNCENVKEKMSKQSFFCVGSDKMKNKTNNLSEKSIDEKNKLKQKVQDQTKLQNSLILNPKELRLKSLYPDMSENELRLLSKNNAKDKPIQKSNINVNKNDILPKSKFNTLMNREKDDIKKKIDLNKSDKSTILKSNNKIKSACVTNTNNTNSKFQLDKKQKSTILKYDIFGSELKHDDKDKSNKLNLFKNLKREKSTIKNIKEGNRFINQNQKENINNLNSNEKINENFAYEININTNYLSSENEIKRKLASNGIHAYKIEVSKKESIKPDIPPNEEKYIVYVRSSSVVKNNNSEIKCKKIKDCLSASDVRTLEIEKNGRAIINQVEKKENDGCSNSKM